MGFRSALLSKGISEISHGGGQLRRCTSRHCSGVQVSGLLGSPESPALDFLEALLALGLFQCHETAFEGVPHRH